MGNKSAKPKLTQDTGGTIHVILGYLDAFNPNYFTMIDGIDIKLLPGINDNSTWASILLILIT